MSAESLPRGLVVRHDLRPGDLGRLIELHGVTYAGLPGFGLRFEAFVARTFAEYGLDDDFNGRIWLLERGDRLLGSTAMVRRPNRVMQLRWVVLTPELRGSGLGRQLVERALAWAREQSARHVVLETTDGLDASAGLYRSLGFVVEQHRRIDLWEGSRALIRMQKDL